VRLRVLATAAAAALVTPGGAAAHVRTSSPAVDYEVKVAPLRAPLAGAVAVRVYRTDLALGLTALGGHRVVVLGYLGEPFLRFAPGAVYVNSDSLTARGSGLTASPRSGSARWRLYAHRPRLVWHDARVRGLPKGVDRGRWTIPVRVDGRRTVLAGEIRRVHVPPSWPWLALGAVFLAATVWILARRSADRLRTAAIALGALAGYATLLISIGFAAAPSASEGIWVEAGNEIVLTLIGFAVLLWGSRDARALAGGALGLLALAVGLTDLPVFLHGLVLSVTPGNVTRAAVAVAIAAGTAATVVGGFVFFDVLAHYEEPSSTEQYL
jgi:hypothetical protein